MAKQAGGAGDFPGESAVISTNEKVDVNLFYEKLDKLNESSGLTLLFNFRQAMLDLHRFYMEVIKRGGFYQLALFTYHVDAGLSPHYVKDLSVNILQVTKKGKWDDVALVSNSRSRVSMSAAQLQKVYEMLILQYELMYCRKMPNQWPAKNSQGTFGCVASPSCSTGKRKHCDSSSPFSSVRLFDQDGRTEEKDCCEGQETVNKNSTMIISANSNVKKIIVDVPKAPQKPRTGYHIFLRLETHRLRENLGERSNSHNLRDMAVAAWRRLPEKDKLPYIEASKMDKERYEQEMAAHMQKGKSQALLSTTTPKEPPSDDVYHVSFEDDSEDLHSPDESVVGLAIEAMKNAGSNDSVFQIDWDNGPPAIRN